MSALLKYIKFVFAYIVNILSFRPFPDFPLTLFEVLIGCFLIKYVIKLLFGGFKEVNTSLGFNTNDFVSKTMSNHERQKQINNDYIPQHAYHYHPKHESK